MSDLTEWLLACITEDEADVRDSRMPRDVPEWWMPEWLTPGHLLAVCKAHREIVEGHPGRWVSPEDWWACSTCGVPGEYDTAWPCPTLRAIATIYADRPGWREEWAS